MADLNFSQPERRSLWLPIVLALVVLLAAGFAVYRLTPHTTADVLVTHVVAYPAHVVFRGETRVVGAEQAEDELYIFSTVRITDRLRLPLFLKDFSATLIPNDGSLPPATSAVESRDLPSLYTSFPRLRAMAAAQGVPELRRDTRIDPGQTVEGYVLVHFPVTPAVWDSRNDAVLTLDLYHQSSLSVSLPKSANPTGAADTLGK